MFDEAENQKKIERNLIDVINNSKNVKRKKNENEVKEKLGVLYV